MNLCGLMNPTWKSIPDHNRKRNNKSYMETNSQSQYKNE